MLLSKCRQSLDRYSHHLVIGNLLSTRKREVVFVDREGLEWIRTPEVKEGEEEVEIESLIVPAVIRKHQEMLKRRKSGDTGRY